MEKTFRILCAGQGIHFAATTLLWSKAALECEPPVNLDGEVSMSGSIGANTYVRAGGNLGGVRSIGRYCSIANGVVIGGGEHPTDWMSTHPFQYGGAAVSRKWSRKPDHVYLKPPRGAAQVVIGNDVWIGTNAVIARGVTIGDGAIIGAGAVVTKDVPAYAVAVGVPAKVIRYRFDASTIARMQRVKWWDYTADSLLGVRFNDAARALDDVEKRIAAGTLEPIPATVIRITGAGTCEVKQRSRLW
ncbi:CatB-related O-acetyltransferase [Mesorhizobium sp. ASY16-5R]|uniref:CatB-related O-acetyltransferase n=1 Tax=Mesorhizobium sp. ASY16-5R TaxID=3445772 RepID=UPI003FA0C2C4